MKLEPNTAISHYKIISSIGKGGMGEVYLAEDTKLDRKVAIKVLPAELSNDEDRLQRFEQEAKATSALNHPNILTVYDNGEHDGSPFIVAELLEGEELRDRLDEVQIPLRKTIDFAQQIVSGLTAAHEKGIVHRDLKPENLFITKDDRVKILDFGLAKVRETGGDQHGSEDATRKALTDPGMVMGTAGYMSPEQVRGAPVDHRSDIFSFGVILYEMITGNRAFHEESLAETMSAIVKDEPPEMTESNPNISPALERIVHRCLEKKPDRRFHSAHDLGFALESLSTPTSSSGANLTAAASAIGPEKERSPWLDRLPWAVALLLLIGCVVLAGMYFSRPASEERIVTFAVSMPASSTAINYPVISPDGRKIVYVATVEGETSLYTRSLDSKTGQRLAGTEGAWSPFWSPDSRYIGFFANGKLRKADTGGGPIQNLCDASSGTGGTWNRHDVILFGDKHKGIKRVSATGGEATMLIPVDMSRKESEVAHPRFLPDGDHFFFYIWYASTNHAEIFVAPLDGNERKLLLKNNSNVAYVEPGYLLFARENTLMAQRFSVSRFELSGDPFPVAEDLAFNGNDGYSNFSVSENGTMISLKGSDTLRQLAWFDRDGTEISKVAQPGTYINSVLSPDGKKAAVQRRVDGNSDIWVIDLERGLPVRFTFDASSEDDPAWSPDGSVILFSSDRDNGIRRIYRKSAGGAEKEELVSDAVRINNSGIDWSLDGKNVIYETTNEKGSLDLWVLPMTGGEKPYPLLQSEFAESLGRFSPDGRYFAYVSSESGKPEVYVQSFPPSGGKWQVSTGGGGQPHWRRDGKELFYISADKRMMAVSVQLDGTFEQGQPNPLFLTQVSSFISPDRYDVSADGQRFLINSPVEETSGSPIDVILNWTSTLKK